MAIAPPMTLRSTAGRRGALPRAAPAAPVTVRAASTAMIVTATRTGPGTSVMASSGSTAPAMNDTKLAPEACQGLASCSGSMPSSASAWAASASWAVNWLATCRARPGVSPFACKSPASSSSSAPPDSVSSCRSSASRARSESRWLLTDTYSPDAIASPPANIPARPAVDTTPSFAPRTAARSQLSRVARPPPCGSRCPGALTRASRIAITSRISRPARQPGDQGLRSSCWSRPRGPGSRRGLCRRQDLLSTAPRAGGAGSRFHWAGGAIGHTAAGRAGRDDRSGVRAVLIVASFGITRNLFVLFTSNAFAVLGLRARYFLLAGSIYRFTYPDKVLPCCWVHRREDARLLRPSRAGTVSLAVIVAVWGGSRRRPAARSAPCSPDRQNRCNIERDHQPPGGLRDFVRNSHHRY